MNALLDQTLTINLIGTTLVVFVAARIYLVPRLGSLGARGVLLPILLLHSLRHLGLMFLAPGVVHAGMPRAFAVPAAVGDFVTAVLALACIPAVLYGWPASRGLVWVFNVFGSLDLVTAITLGTVYDAQHHMGAAYWIPAFWVPALLVTHYVTFIVLIKHWQPTEVRDARRESHAPRRGRVEALGGH